MNEIIEYQLELKKDSDCIRISKVAVALNKIKLQACNG